jgi:hypothetical protein
MWTARAQRLCSGDQHLKKGTEPRERKQRVST